MRQVLLLLSVAGIFFISSIVQAQTPVSSAVIDGHPGWIEQGNIYEVNIRQYTPQGTFKAFEPNLQRLKNMGVQTLWFMPINPISVKDRKGKLGSYYAVSNYRAINPEYGDMNDWKALVKKSHSMGFKVIIDWVPNHTGADHYWLTTHPDF
jgi:glycosidase